MPEEYLRSHSPLHHPQVALATGLQYQLPEVTSLPRYQGRGGKTATSIKSPGPLWCDVTGLLATRSW